MAWGAAWRDILRDYDPRTPKGRGRAVMALGGFIVGILFVAAAFSPATAPPVGADRPPPAQASSREDSASGDDAFSDGSTGTGSAPSSAGDTAGDDGTAGAGPGAAAGDPYDDGGAQYDAGDGDPEGNQTQDQPTDPEGGLLPSDLGGGDSVDGLPPMPTEDDGEVEIDSVPLP